MSTYDQNIQPVPNQRHWVEDEGNEKIWPPPKRTKFGRPKKNRRREADEPKKKNPRGTVTCKKCDNYGHNVKTCAKRQRTQEGECSSNQFYSTTGIKKTFESQTSCQKEFGQGFKSQL